MTRPDIVRAVHRAYLEVGRRRVETNTFGANLANLAEYDIADRIFELAQAGAALARAEADEFSTPPSPGSCSARSAPAPSCPPWATRPTWRCGTPTQQQVAGMLDGGIDAVMVETCQDLLQTKSAVSAPSGR